MYSIIRYGLLIVLICILFLIFKDRKWKKKLFILSVIIFALVWSCLFYFPFENLFISFASPEEAFNYRCSGAINTVIEGENTAMILDSDDGKLSFFQNSKTGWKLSLSYSAKIIYSELFCDYSIVIYKYNELDEYYMLVYKDHMSDVSDIVDISDNKGSQFENQIEKEERFNTYIIRYLTYFSDFEGYELNIDGRMLKISD